MQPALSLIQEPLWLEQTPPGEPRRKARLRWMLDLCALYYSPEGRMTDLSLACDLSSSAIGKAKHLGVISPEMAICLEKLLGRAWVTREILLPELFSVES